MSSAMQPLISAFRPLARAIALTAACAALITPAAQAQNRVPASALEAARTPQFAAKLAHGASHLTQAAPPRASYRSPADAFRQNKRGWPQQGNDLYDNGPINGSIDAWTINFGFVVSDTITLGNGNGPIQGMTFGAWLFPGDILNSVEVSITSSEFGGTTYFDQVVSFTQSGCQGNQFGFNVCTATSANLSGPNLAGGTYWVNLSNAVVNDGDPVYWDENSGIDCDSPGCPSFASNNSVGTIPSEAFSILGMNTCFSPDNQKPAPEAKAVPAPRSPTQTYQVLYNFTGGADGGYPTAGVTLDEAGNVYGVAAVGGNPADEGGTAFQLKRGASGYTFHRLYTFTGANGASPFSTPVLAPDGRLYGTTVVGGANSAGTIFGLSPPPNIQPSIFSSWDETLLYDFLNLGDGAARNGTIALDSSGNIYGNATTGGENFAGTLFEYTSSGLQVLHAFPAFRGDGAAPLGVAYGSSGLFGITKHGGTNGTGTLYTTAGGYRVLNSFGPYQTGGGPTSVTIDSLGNVYTADTSQACFGIDVNISEFSPPASPSRCW